MALEDWDDGELTEALRRHIASGRLEPGTEAHRLASQVIDLGPGSLSDQERTAWRALIDPVLEQRLAHSGPAYEARGIHLEAGPEDGEPDGLSPPRGR